MDIVRTRTDLVYTKENTVPLSEKVNENVMNEICNNIWFLEI